MAGNAIFGVISLFLTAGACVMIFFVVLAGVRDVTPLNQIYFLWADTSNIGSARDISQWTLWNVCGSTNSNGGGNNVDCGNSYPAHPFLPQQNFGTDQNVPEAFLDNPKTYYYLSRFTFAFYLISLFFMVSSLATGLLSLCSRLGSAISAVTAAFALFCLTFTATIMTGVYVLGRTSFNDVGRAAGIGTMAFAFTWTSVACLINATLLYCLGFSIARRHHRTRALETKETRRGLPFFRRRHSPAGESERAFT